MLHQVGVGALGPVFRTYEPTRDRLVAVKVFRLDITPEQAQALADELAVAPEAGLFHPSIVEPIASGVEGSVAYRAEEYVAAESLDVAMRHYAPAAMDKVLPFISQLAAAVDFARMAGVGHGALHPRDIFVTPEEARATGFGIVEALERVGLRAPVRRPYAAPERVEGGPWSTQADVFSLGAIAFELLTGRRPAGAGAGIGDLDGASVGQHAASVLAVLVRATEEDPSARFPTAMAFASALESASRGVLPAAAVSSAVPKAARKPEVAPPPPVDDITPEREEDQAHFMLSREQREQEIAKEEAEALELFDLEAVEDLALEQPPETERFADDFNFAAIDELPPPQPSGKSPVFDIEEEPEIRPQSKFPPQPEDDEEVERVPVAVPPRRSIDYVPEDTSAVPPRTSLFARLFMAFMLVMIGFVAGWGARSAVNTRTGPDAAEADAAKQAGATPPAKTDEGKAYSEQAVTPAPPAQTQPQQPPPVPGDAAPAPSTGAPAAAPPRPVTPPAAPATGRIIVRSVPSNAGVTVDGTWRGRTPLTLEKLPLGSHEVRVVQTGFAVARESVALTARAPARTLSFRLQKSGAATPAPAAPPPAPERGRASPPATTRSNQPPAATPARGPGSLYVDSRPRGAAVFIDGRPVGVTPATIPDVTPGAHVIRLELADHRTWTANSQVIAGQQTRVTGSLERIK